MYLTGFADEAANDIGGQIRAITTLGWKNLESRNVNGINLVNLSEADFEAVVRTTAEAGIHINCFGSAVANWSKRLSDPPDSSYDELRRAVPRMHRLNTRLIRVMSFACAEDRSIDEPSVEREVIKRMKELARIAREGDIVLVHENCDNWGGRSYEHTLRLLDAVDSPHFRLVFDTGNPVFRKDIRGAAPFGYQNAFEFYSRVRDAVEYVHIKDGVMENGMVRFTYPGEGKGCVREILRDLHKTGYDGGISIEPHLQIVAHDNSVTATEEARFDSFVEYGRRMEGMLEEIGWRVPRGREGEGVDTVTRCRDSGAFRNSPRIFPPR